LNDTSATKASDEKYLRETTALCTQKDSDFENRQKLREDELVAIERAVEILQSDAVSGNAEKHLPKLVQRATSLLSLRRSHQPLDDESRNLRVVDYLRTEGRRLHSRILSSLAVKVEADPFKKVKQMIQDLIVRLLEEANEEAEHKGWCDKELASNEITRKEKSTKVELLHAEKDELTASISKLGEQVAELTNEVANLDAALAEATEMRSAEKKDNERTIKDAQEAQTAVSRATTVLKEFYAKAGEATSLVQQQPAIFDSPYTGMQGESGGVVGMLEVIQSDFARLESETKASEALSQREFDEFAQDTAVTKTQKTKDIEHKETLKQNQESQLVVTGSDLEGTQRELDTALNYYDKLKPSCVDTGTSYEERVQRREEEIESLQEALRILNGEDFA